MKRMKKVVYLLIMAAGLALASCEKDEVGKLPPKRLLENGM